MRSKTAMLGLVCYGLTMAALACGSSDEKKVAGAGGSGGMSAGGGASGAPVGVGHGGAGASAQGGEGTQGGAAAQGGTSASQGGSSAQAGNAATPEGGASTSGGDAGFDSGGLADNGGQAGCENATALPDLTQGEWAICNAVATNAVVWTGVLTIATETPTCEGASLVGSFHWVSSSQQTGDTQARGTYDAATHQITLEELQPSGSVVAATDFMTYDVATDHLINGSWTCSCPSATWSSAARVAKGSAISCD